VFNFLFVSCRAKDQLLLLLLQVFYSPEFALVGADAATANETLEGLAKARPEKKQQMLDNLRRDAIHS